MRPQLRRLLALGITLALPLGLAACGGDDKESTGSSGDGVTLRLGYFPNVTHAPAVYGIESGDLATRLGSGIDLEPSIFNAGGEAAEAMFADAIDATFIGSGPAVTAFQKSGGDVRIVSGLASGGAFLVVSDSIDKPEDLAGRKIATPQLGNTQDVALRFYLKDELGLETDVEGGGDVNIIPQENSLTLDAMKAGDIDGAWVPEPWATRLVQEAGAKVLVDERDLWPDGKFATTVLLVKKDYLAEHPDVIKKLIEATAAQIDALSADTAAAAQTVADGIEQASGKAIAVDLVTASFKSVAFGLDPLVASIKTAADHAVAVELLDPVDDIDGLFDLTQLNAVLAARAEPEISV